MELIKLWCSTAQIQLVCKLDGVEKITPVQEKIASGQTVTNYRVLGCTGLAEQIETILKS